MVYFRLSLFSVNFVSLFVLILRTTEYSDQCRHHLNCTWQSAAVGGQVVGAADPPPAVVAAPEAVPTG